MTETGHENGGSSLILERFFFDLEVQVRDHLEEEGGAKVTGRKSEQADEGDERHGGSPPG